MKNQIISNIEPRVSLIRVDKLIPHENFDQNKVDNLSKKILSESKWSQPIIVDNQDYIILDGHHRYNVAIQLGLTQIPCLLVEYDDPRISVSSWRNSLFVDRQIVRKASTSILLPVKTSMHEFDFELPSTNFSIASLKSEKAA